ncbi:MAG: hypothetical protein WBZ01_21575 [Terriglobales bacterium]|jgi:hypothetical protein
MDADFSIELGRDDPVLDFPWTDPAGVLGYVDLKRRPEWMASIKEAEQFPELGQFLRAMNSARSMVETAKCDGWSTSELSPEEEIYGASCKFASYVDVVFSDIDARLVLSAHEQLARKLVDLLWRTPETPSAAEVCVRRCYFGGNDGVREGYYFTLYVSGYGNDDSSARLNWGVALKLVGNAILQLSAGG